MKIIVDGCKDIFHCNMLWNKVSKIRCNGSFYTFYICVFLKKLLQNRIKYFLCNSKFFCLFLTDINPFCDIDCHIRKNLYSSIGDNTIVSFYFHIKKHCRHSSILNFVCTFSCNFIACLCNDIAIYNNIIGKGMSCYSIFK